MRPAVGALIFLFVKKVEKNNDGYVSTIYALHQRLLTTDEDSKNIAPLKVLSEDEIFVAFFCGLLILIAVAALEIEASKIKPTRLIFTSCSGVSRPGNDADKENHITLNNDVVPSGNKAVNRRKLSRLLTEVDVAKKPEPVIEGNISQVYKLFNMASEVVSIFKPYTAHTNFNNSLALSAKMHCINEVTAYKLDQMLEKEFRADVPETRHVRLPPSVFKTKGEVRGSLQKYLGSVEVSENFGPSRFSKDDILNIGLLDLRILNCDRHSGNLLYSADIEKLFPIDHALSFPEIQLKQDLSANAYLSGDMSDEKLYLRNVSFDWLMFPQAKEAFPDKHLHMIRKLDIAQQLRLMKKAGYNIKQRLACFCSLTLLKIGALKYNKTLYDIGSLVQRQGSRKTPSVLEMLIDDTLKGVKKNKILSEDTSELLLFSKLFNEKVEDFLRL